MRRYIRRHGLLHPGERLLVAVSGGQDSLALLLILSRLAEELGIELAVAHFDHRLRSRQEARGDVEAARGMAKALRLPFVSGSGLTRTRARRHGQSLEEAARHLRLSFLGREARRLKAGVVALGHTMDDRAETVLLHLLRGSGLDGLIGLRGRSSWPLGRGPALARPLLEVRRAETLHYCREKGVTPRDDPTNLLLDATRNRVRHELLPALRRFNPRIEEALSRLGEAAAGAAEHLHAQADAEWRTLATTGDEEVSFARRPFAALAPAIRARLLRRAVRHLAGPLADVEMVHVRAIEEALAKKRASVSISQGLTASVGARGVRLASAPAKPAATIPETSLTVPGRTDLPGWTVTAEIVAPPPAEPRPRSRFEAWLDADALGGDVVVRARRPGDRLRPLGLGGERKLQDVLVDAKVPLEERDGVPVVCASWGIAWVVGQRLDERAALREGTRSALRLRFRRLRRGH